MGRDASSGRCGPRTLADLLTFAWLGKRWGLFVLPLLLLATAALALAVGCPVAQWCVDKKSPGELRRLCGIGEPFGNGYGVIAVAVAIWLLDPGRRRKLARVLAMAFGAGMVANWLKLLVARVRPHRFDFAGTVQETFVRWLPLGAGGSGRQSFPSAHTATAVGLAIGLAWLYPRARWLFATLAVLVACQRVLSGAHFASDTLVGMAVGWVFAMPFLHHAWLSARFDRLESRSIGLRQWVSESLRGAPSVPLSCEAGADEDRSRAA